MKSPEKDPNFGWWTLSTTITPSPNDLEHIAEMIVEGFTQGEMSGEEDKGEALRGDYGRDFHGEAGREKKI